MEEAVSNWYLAKAKAKAKHDLGDTEMDRRKVKSKSRKQPKIQRRTKRGREQEKNLDR